MVSFQICSQEFFHQTKTSKGKLHGFAGHNFLINVSKKQWQTASAINLSLTFLVNMHTLLNKHTAKHCTHNYNGIHKVCYKITYCKSRFILMRARLTNTLICLQGSSTWWVCSFVALRTWFTYQCTIHMFNLGTGFIYLPEEYLSVHYRVYVHCVYLCILYACMYLLTYLCAISYV